MDRYTPPERIVDQQGSRLFNNLARWLNSRIVGIGGSRSASAPTPRKGTFEVQYGFVSAATIGGGLTHTITFPTPFAGGVVCIIVTGGPISDAPYVSAPSNTNAVIASGAGASATIGLDWMAVGW